MKKMLPYIRHNTTKNSQGFGFADKEAVTVLTHNSSKTGNGYIHLKQYLKEMATVRQALTAGKPLVFCLRDQETVPAPKAKQSKFTKSPPSKTTSDKDFVPTNMTSMQQYSIEPAELEIKRRIKFRKRQHILKKMDWIYKILWALTSMTTEDLKTVVPLSSQYVSIIMKDVEKPNNFWENSQRNLVSSPLDDEQNFSSDEWETFVNASEPESKVPDAKLTGYKLGQFSLRQRVKLKELENDAGELPPWLNLLWDKSVTSEKPPQTAKNTYEMLQRIRTECRDVQRYLDNQMEMDIIEKKVHQEDRMKTLLNALMASKMDITLPVLLSSLKNEVKGPKSRIQLWHRMLQLEASEFVTDEEYRNIMHKIWHFHSFSHRKLPYCKEKFCLLVLSLPVFQLLCPALQDALLFLTENVLQLPARKLKHWFQHLKLPFYEESV